VLKYKLKILIYKQPLFVSAWRNSFNPFSTKQRRKCANLCFSKPRINTTDMDIKTLLNKSEQ